MSEPGTPTRSPTPVDPSFVDTVEHLEETDTPSPVPAAEDAEEKPPKPIMGHVVKASKGWATWTGGKPKADWTGLDPSALLMITSPNQLRPDSVSAAQKGYNHRRTSKGTKTK